MSCTQNAPTHVLLSPRASEQVCRHFKSCSWPEWSHLYVVYTKLTCVNQLYFYDNLLEINKPDQPSVKSYLPMRCVLKLSASFQLSLDLQPLNCFTLLARIHFQILCSIYCGWVSVKHKHMHGFLQHTHMCI